MTINEPAHHRSQGLADDLKDATWQQHQIAETSGIIASIVAGKVDPRVYALYIRNLLAIYEALEHASLASRCNDKIAMLLDKKIHRAAALTSDLQQLTDQAKHLPFPILQRTEVYRQRIIHLAKSNSPNFIGHIYVRYLGDLNGGQMLHRLMLRQLGGSALSFYLFPEIPDLKIFRKAYRQKLNNLSVSQNERDTIIAEAIKAFDYNIELSESVEHHQFANSDDSHYSPLKQAVL